MILQLKSNINTRINNEEETELHVAAKHNLIFSAKSLIKAGADVNAKSVLLETPLHKASHEGHVEMVKILIKNGANINEKNTSNETALDIAVTNGDISMVELLIENSAKIDLKETTIQLAVKLNLKEIGKLFAKRYAECYQMTKSETVLHTAVRRCDAEYTKIFIKGKIVDIDSQDKFGHTPLHIAIFGKNVSILKILLENGAIIHKKRQKWQVPSSTCCAIET